MKSRSLAPGICTSLHQDMAFLLLFCLFVLLSRNCLSYTPSRVSSFQTQTQFTSISRVSFSLLCDKKPVDVEETTKKYGFEVGLWKSFTNKDANVKPQDLLKKYGVAYLVTSITFAIISYAICYFLVSNGVDVAALLDKVGIKANAAASNAGTAGIAYAIHKAASPIRFPPTVALTPIVAEWLGKKPAENSEERTTSSTETL